MADVRQADASTRREYLADLLGLLRGWGAWLALTNAVGAVYLLVWSPWLADVPMWTLPVGVAVIALATWWAVAAATGYRPATEAERSGLATGSLWHVTDAEGAFDKHQLTGALEAAHCRWMSRAWRRDRPWSRRVRAVYVFAARPRAGQITANVRGRRRAWLLELEGSALPPEVLVRGDGAVALPAGFAGRLRSLVELTGKPDEPRASALR